MELEETSDKGGHLTCSKNPKNSDTQKKCCKYPEMGTVSFYHIVMDPKDADRMANSVNPDQTAPLGAV